MKKLTLGLAFALGMTVIAAAPARAATIPSTDAVSLAQPLTTTVQHHHHHHHHMRRHHHHHHHHHRRRHHHHHH